MFIKLGPKLYNLDRVSAIDLSEPGIVVLTVDNFQVERSSSGNESWSLERRVELEGAEAERLIGLLDSGRRHPIKEVPGLVIMDLDHSSSGAAAGVESAR